MVFTYQVEDYQPELPDNYGPKENSDPQDDVFVLSKRPDFHPSVHDRLEAKWASSGMTRAVNIGGSELLQYQCGSCKQWGDGALMHLGHKQNWKDYVAARKPLTAAAAKAAYNDLENLRFEHIVCNVSHLFENFDQLSDRQKAVALRSHALFKGFSQDEIDRLSLEDIFRQLSTRYEETDIAEGVYYDVSDETSLLLALPVVQHTNQSAINWKTLRRPQWDRSTRAGLYTIWHSNGWVMDGSAGGSAVGRFYRCGSCGNWGEGHSMHLGHIVDWKTHLKNCGVTTVAEAQWAYNDLNNLRFEHPTCNMGHEWEGIDGVLASLEVLTTINQQAPDSPFFSEFNAHRQSVHQLQSDVDLMCIVAIETVTALTHDVGNQGIRIPRLAGDDLILTQDECRSLRQLLAQKPSAKGEENRSLNICGVTVSAHRILELHQQIGLRTINEQSEPLSEGPKVALPPPEPQSVPGAKRKRHDDLPASGDRPTKRQMRTPPASDAAAELNSENPPIVTVDEFLTYASMFDVDIE